MRQCGYSINFSVNRITLECNYTQFQCNKTNNSKEEFKMKKKIDLGDIVITIGWIAASLATTIVTQNLVDKGERAVSTAYHNYKDNKQH